MVAHQHISTRTLHKLGHSQPGSKMVSFMVGIVPYQPSSTRAFKSWGRRFGTHSPTDLGPSLCREKPTAPEAILGRIMQTGEGRGGERSQISADSAPTALFGACGSLHPSPPSHEKSGAWKSGSPWKLTSRFPGKGHLELWT